jgi:hypothetical protein
LATTAYRDFFTPIASIVIRPLLGNSISRRIDLPDVVTGPNSIAAAAHELVQRPLALISPGIVELAANPILARPSRSESVWLRGVLVIIVALNSCTETNFQDVCLW